MTQQGTWVVCPLGGPGRRVTERGAPCAAPFLYNGLARSDCVLTSPQQGHGWGEACPAQQTLSLSPSPSQLSTCQPAGVPDPSLQPT